MPVNILMPALSPTMEKGNLAKWLKKEGDKVKPGDVIAEIETDKATMEYEAIDEGTLAKIVVPEGTPDVPVHQLIAVLATEGEDVKAAAAAAVDRASGARAQPTPKPREKVAERATQQDGRVEPPPPAPLPTGGRDRAGDGGTSPAPQPGSRRIFSSPLARRLARQAGIDLFSLHGSGPHGRIIARDVQAATAGAQQPAQAASVPRLAPSVPAPPPAAEKIRALFEPGSYQIVPHDAMRRIIARRLVEAKLTIPHFYLSMDCNVANLLSMREEINALAPKNNDGDPAYKISVNDIVIKALALALQRVPDANVTWTEDAMLKHTHSDIGVAVSIPGGLITPIVRHAEAKPLSTISNEMRDFAARARARKLKPEEYQGGSSAVSNLGMFGIKEFAAVINPPHATILAVGAAEQRAVVKNGVIEPQWMMTTTLSTDHRAVDGALGAQLLRAFQTLIENPVLMMV
jgi:pyruvate dehydrogenase E2 component (dihydrolipoamide acetyltransferase)